MNTAAVEMTEQDKKVRKQWLIAQWGTLCYPLLILVFGVGSTSRDALAGMIAGLLIFLMLGGLGFWIVYHCAYKKFGTRLLMFLLVTGPFLTCISVSYDIMKSRFSWALVPSLALSIWWYVMSYKLRKVNKRIKGPMPADSKYLISLHGLKTAATVEELEWNFSNLINHWPQHTDLTFKEYESRKLILCKPCK